MFRTRKSVPSGCRHRQLRALFLRTLWLGSFSGFAWIGHAANQTWLGDGGNGGNGNWATAADWSPNTWVSGNVAVFGGTAGTVTVGTQTAGGLTFNVGGYILDAGTLTLASGSVITTSGGTTTFTSALALGGSIANDALTKTGTGTLSLATSNSSLGTAAAPAVWTVNGGTLSGGLFTSVLSVTLGNNLGASPTNATTQLILDSGTLEVRGSGAANTNTVGAMRTFQINAAGGAIHDISGFSDTYNNAIVNNATAGTSSLYLSDTAGTMTLAGVVSGNGSLTWSGAGTLALTNTNTYAGGTTINSGIVSFTTNANLGASSGVVTLSGGTLSATAAASLAGSTSAVFAHNIATGTTGGTIDVASGGVLGLNYFNQNTTGNITGSGPLTKTGAGQLILSGNNSGYTGNWTVNGGLLQVQYNGSTSVGTGSMTLAAGTELSLSYGNTLSNPITSAGSTLSYSIGGGGKYSGAITLVSGTTTTVGLRDFYSASTAESGSITGAISGAGALATSGGGTLTLTGTNTYAGTTNVASGTLLVNGSNSGATGNVAVSNSGSILGGIGSIGGATTVNSGAGITGGTVGTVGSLTLASTLTLNSGSTYLVDVSGKTADQLVISGTLLSNGATVTINSGTLDGSTTYIIASYGSDTGSTFALSGASGYSLVDTGTMLELVPTVPEPATWLGGALLLGVAGRCYRRRAHQTAA